MFSERLLFFHVMYVFTVQLQQHYKLTWGLTKNAAG